MEYTYSEVKSKKGVVKYKHWTEEFKDESTGDSIFIERKKPIELNGEELVWYSNSEIAKMSKEEREKLLI